jgi:hypothetical protein
MYAALLLLLLLAGAGCCQLPRARPFPVSILLEYFYTNIRFYTPALSALLGLAGRIYLS